LRSKIPDVHASDLNITCWYTVPLARGFNSKQQDNI